jgi:hypothetical protein
VILVAQLVERMIERETKVHGGNPHLEPTDPTEHGLRRWKPTTNGLSYDTGKMCIRFCINEPVSDLRTVTMPI